MVKFSSKNELSQWLESQPLEIGVILSARTALRAIPVSEQSLRAIIRNGNRSFLLSYFRVLSTSFCYSASLDASVANVSVKTSEYAESFKISERIPRFNIKTNEFLNSFLKTAMSLSRTISSASYAKDSADKAASTYASVSAARTSFVDNNVSYNKIFNKALYWDISQIESSINGSNLIIKPIWPNKIIPSELKRHWEKFCSEISIDRNEMWHVWTDWCEDRRDGKPYNIEMEREIVLIPDEDWEKGPAHVNAMIAEIRAKYAAKASTSKIDAEKQAIIDLLHTDPLRVALADFTFDDMASLMRMVPFPEDNTNLEDDSLERDRKELLSSLNDLAKNLSEDLEEAGRNSRDCASIARDLQRYASETRKRPPRARFLWMQGAALNTYRLTTEVYEFLPVIERQKLDAMVDLHLDLMRLYYRGALARVQDAEVLELTQVVSLRDLNGMIANAAHLLDAVKDEDGAHVEPETIATLRDLAEQTDALIDRLETMSPEERERSERQLWARTKSGAMTVLRLGLRMSSVGADFATLSNVDFDGLIAKLKALIS